MHADIRENLGDRNKRHQFDEAVSRKHFLSTQDVRNVRRKLDNDQVMRHSNDAISTSMRVHELKQESFNSVLIYKQQGVSDPLYPHLPKDSFVLAIQTEFQQKLYKDNAHKVLCIDSTHCTNAYAFKLITCIVPDKFGQGKIHCQ